MKRLKPDEVDDLFGDYMGSQLIIEVDGKKYELDMRLPDLSRMMSASANEGMSEEDANKLGDTILQLFYRSYLPFWDEATDSEQTNLGEEQKNKQTDTKKALSNFVVKHYNTIFSEIGRALGWITPDQAVEVEKKAKELQALGSQPQ